MQWPWCAFGVLALTLDCTTVRAQSLGDVARKAEESRKGAAKGSLVFDQGDLHPGVAWRELLDIKLTAGEWSKFVTADRALGKALAGNPSLQERMAGLEVSSIRSLERWLLREPALTRALAAARVDLYGYAATHLAVAIALDETAPSVAAVPDNRSFLRARKEEVAALAVPRATVIGRPVAPTPGPTPVDAEPPMVAPSPALLPRPAADAGGPIDARRGAEIPDFAFVDFDGKSRRLSDFRGRYVMLDFWGSWCGPCRAEVPYAKAAYEKYRSRGFEIVGLDYERGATEDEVRQLLQKSGVTWTFATADSARGLMKRFGIKAFPTLILLDPQARVVEDSTDALRGNNLAKTLDAILPK